MTQFPNRRKFKPQLNIYHLKKVKDVLGMKALQETFASDKELRTLMLNPKTIEREFVNLLDLKPKKTTSQREVFASGEFLPFKRKSSP